MPDVGTDAPAPLTPKGKRARQAVAGNVLALGMVSLVTDISSEMVTAILPVYLVLGLGFSPLQFGVIDGLYSGVTALVRLAGGHAADRWGRRKLVAGVGYWLSALAKLGLVIMGTATGAGAGGGSATAIGAVLATDRVGKGIRTAPRDALISLSTPPERQGRAFGVHRAMDTVGAFLGPLLAFVLLWAVVGGYHVVFFASFCIAVLGVLLLVLFVRECRTPASDSKAAAAHKKSVSLRAAFGLLREARFRRLCVWAMVLGVATVGDAFIYLLLQQRLDISPALFAMLPLGTTGVYLLLAIPLGRLADRIGRPVVFIGGHVALLGCYLLLFGVVDGWLLLAGSLLLHGVFYASTDGVLMAAAGPLLPAELRSSGMALLQTGQAMAKLVSSLLFGAAWSAWGLHTAIILSVGALGLAVAAALIFRPLRTVSAAERAVGATK